MKYTEPKGVLRDILLKDTINLNKLMERWSLLLGYKIEVEELKIMLSESSTIIHRYRDPNSEYEKTRKILSIHYTGKAIRPDYYAPSNLYVFKNDLIKAEVFYEFRKEIRAPEKNQDHFANILNLQETNEEIEYYNTLTDKRKRQVDTIKRAIQLLEATKIESGVKPLIHAKCKEIATVSSDFEIVKGSFHTIWQCAKKSGRVKLS